MRAEGRRPQTPRVSPKFAVPTGTGVAHWHWHYLASCDHRALAARSLSCHLHMRSRSQHYYMPRHVACTCALIVASCSLVQRGVHAFGMRHTRYFNAAHWPLTANTVCGPQQRAAQGNYTDRQVAMKSCARNRKCSAVLSLGICDSPAATVTKDTFFLCAGAVASFNKSTAGCVLSKPTYHGHRGKGNRGGKGGPGGNPYPPQQPPGPPCTGADKLVPNASGVGTCLSGVLARGRTCTQSAAGNNTCYPTECSHSGQLMVGHCTSCGGARRVLPNAKGPGNCPAVLAGGRACTQEPGANTTCTTTFCSSVGTLEPGKCTHCTGANSLLPNARGPGTCGSLLAGGGFCSPEPAANTTCTAPGA